ncbi:hypothetical protein BD779DRAFT_326769 [Infundibulicybe gibba]|nr:hypothetical protein BD779DRAFT_326769 [Infundibulicybe gibba]
MSPEQIADKNSGDGKATLVDGKGAFPHNPVAQANSQDSKESNSVVKNTAPSPPSSAKAPLDGGSDEERQKGRQPRQPSPPISDDDELNDEFPEFPGGKPTTIVASKPKPRPKRVGGQEDGDDEFPEHFPGL